MIRFIIALVIVGLLLGFISVPVLRPFLGLITLILYLWAIVSILTCRVDLGSKILWLALLIFLPGIGLIAWLFLGPRDKRN